MRKLRIDGCFSKRARIAFAFGIISFQSHVTKILFHFLTFRTDAIISWRDQHGGLYLNYDVSVAFVFCKSRKHTQHKVQRDC